MPDADGRFAASLTETQSAVVADTIGLVAGRQEDVGLIAIAGIIPGQPAQDPLTGAALFEGPYTVAFIEDIDLTENFITGRNSLIQGNVTLRADLSDNTLSGTDEILTVSGRFDHDSQLTGTVSVLNVPGTLQGAIGSERAYAAFHGGDETHVMSGGFVTERRP